MQRTNLFWIALGLLLSTASFSQVAVAEAEATIEEVVVTGSRIARDTFTSTAPLTVLDAGEISAVGATNIGEFLSRIPQSIAESNSSNNVFAGSSSGLQLTSLRNLGSQRTLTLVNGKRFVSGITPSVGYAVDMNAIPAALIERIEIKTGATSAIYGSDAVAGVVNLIMKEDFEGIEIKVQSNQPEQGNRERYDIDIAMGSNFDNGNAWIAFGYSDDKGISASERDFSDTDLAYYTRGALDALGFPNRAPGDYWLGSSFPPGGRFGDFQGDGTPFRSGLADRPNSDRFNRANFRDLASPTERVYAAAGMTYSISDQLEAKVMVNYNQTEIQTTFEPFPLDLVSGIWDIPKGGTGGLDIATSPLLPALLRTNLLAAGLTNLNELEANTSSRRLVEFQGRGSSIDRRTFAIQSDLTYTFDNGTELELFASWGQTTADQQNNSGINAERTALALDVEVFEGTMRCVSEEARRFGCVPFNPFGVNTISAGAVEYVGLNTQTDQRVEQLVFGATLVGDMSFVPELPGGTIGYAVGFERRVEQGSETPDAAVQAGVTTSNRVAATDGRFDVNEFFAEVSLPVLDNFTVDAAYRIGDYSTVGNQSNWSIGLDWRVAEWARLRGTFSNAVRAPNVSDLFRGAGETFASVQDACDGTTAATPGNLGTNCRSVAAIQQRITDTGAFTLTQVERQSTGGFNGGNPEAEEETADTFTIGFVLTPTWEWAEGFQIAVDYYDIQLEDVLTLPLRSDVVTNCYNVDPGSFDATCPGPVPGGVQTLRNPASGSLIEVNRSFLNQEDWETSGYDIEINYTKDLDSWFDGVPGVLSVNVIWNKLEDFIITDLATGSENDEGGEVEFPDNRLYAGINYSLDRWNFNWTVAWIDESLDSNTPELTNENSDTFGIPLDRNGNTCDATDYHNLSVSYSASDNLEVFLGIKNLFEEDPCALTQITKYGNTGLNTAGSLYDVTGRDYYFGIRARL